MIMTISKDDYDYMNAYTKAVEVIKKHNFEADNAVEYVETLAALEAIKVGLDEMAKSIQYSEDCISRQKAIDAIDALYLDGDSSVSYLADAKDDTLIGKYQAITTLDDLPPVTPKAEQKWIPCEERLPETNDIYLVSMHSYGLPTRDIDGYIQQTDKKWEIYGNKVIAWMPLPEPYKAESEEEE